MPTSNFLTDIIDADLAAGRHTTVITRFPPEPNGYLHIGHAKSICLNFGLAEQYGGRCHMRFDDTNPAKEEQEYVDSILADVRWLGFDWGDHLHFASDYFQACYDIAEKLIVAGKAYVDSLNEEQIREYRGTALSPGRPSPHRERSPDENLDIFRRMRAGEFPDGAHVLRAKGDMAAANMKMRDPLLYRIRHVEHHRVGDAWCIYPMYDYNHPISDAIEGITHSVCTLEFENNRDIYDWVIDNDELDTRPRQYEFARLELTYIITSKRKLLRLVNEKHVDGWDDPRMPTLAGLRRRGVRPEALRLLMERVGVAKANSTVEYEALEVAIRDDLDPICPRVMCVVDPVELVIDNWPAGTVEWLEAPLWTDGRAGTRRVPFDGRLYIERDDFSEEPPPKYFRLAPGREVRLAFGFVVTATVVDKGTDGRVTRIHATYDPATRGGVAEGRKVQGTLHWVSVAHAQDVVVRQYDRLFGVADPGAADVDLLAALNPDSLRVIHAKAEPFLANAEGRYQFLRLGYFYVDPVVGGFNRIVTLKDSWSRPKEAPRPVVPEPVQVVKARVVANPARRDALVAAGVPEMAATVLADDDELHGIYGAAGGGVTVANLVVNDVAALRKTGGNVSAQHLRAVAGLLEAGRLNARTARELLVALTTGGGDPIAVAEARGLFGGADEATIEAAARAAMDSNPNEVASYRGGKVQLMGFFVGQVMKATGGKADAKLVREVVGRVLG